MSNSYETGVIYGWNGGECPVHPESEVMFWFRGFTGAVSGSATEHSWKHENYVGDIIAFQVTKPYVEPKVIWVNEYKSEVFAFKSENAAKSHANSYVIRIAGKYVEAKE